MIGYCIRWELKLIIVSIVRITLNVLGTSTCTVHTPLTYERQHNIRSKAFMTAIIKLTIMNISGDVDD